MTQTNSDQAHIVCPNCQATNRIPESRISDAPSCGKCHQPLFVGAPIELDGQSLSKMVQKNDVLTVIDFWASWCQPCHMMAPHFSAAAQQRPSIVFAKLQTDKYEQAGAAYGIRSLPTMVAFKQGKEIARQSGAMSSGQILQWVQSLV